MNGIDTLPPLREVVETFDLSAKKALGQNFLFDLNLTSKVARTAGDLSQYDVIEVGPGPGGLTRALLANNAKRVIAIERDPRCLPALQQISDHYPDRLTVIEGDALKINWKDLVKGPTKIVANLPYNIGTILLTNWLEADEWPPYYASLTLMFQKEVALRICAEVGDPHYGRLGVLCNWRTHPARAFDVPPEAFSPPPKVVSSVVHIEPKVTPEACNLSALTKVTKMAFGQRRKMLRSSLKALGGAKLLEVAAIEPTKRAEELSVSEFVKLANSL